METVLLDVILIIVCVYSVSALVNFRFRVIETEKKAAFERARKAHVLALEGDNLSAHRWEKLKQKL